MFELRVIDPIDGQVASVHYATREQAEAALTNYAFGALLAVHLHPGEYTEGSRSSAYEPGGDMFFDASAFVRRVFPD